MAVNWPRGASVLEPQQAMVRSVLMAQEWLVPAAMAVNWPVGASVRPSVVDNPSVFEPQQVMVRSVLMAHEWS